MDHVENHCVEVKHIFSCKRQQVHISVRFALQPAASVLKRATANVPFGPIVAVVLMLIKKKNRGCCRYVPQQGRGVPSGARGAQCPERRIIGGWRKIPAVSQVLPSIQNICSRKVRTWGRQTCRLSHLGTPLQQGLPHKLERINT